MCWAPRRSEPGPGCSSWRRPGGASLPTCPRTGRPVGITATPAQFQQLMNRLGAIDRRLAAIERQLGLGEPPAEAEPG